MKVKRSKVFIVHDVPNQMVVLKNTVEFFLFIFFLERVNPVEAHAEAFTWLPWIPCCGQETCGCMG